MKYPTFTHQHEVTNMKFPSGGTVLSDVLEGGNKMAKCALCRKNVDLMYVESVYPDHLSVWNYGQLPEGWTVGRLFKKHPSMPFNPSMANVFFRSGDIESWGRGYRRIIRKNEEAGLLPPLVETEDGLRVTHYIDVNAQVRAMGAEERMVPILELVLRNHRVTNADVQRLLGVSKPTATRMLQKLDVLLELVGHGAGAYYKIRIY